MSALARWWRDFTGQTARDTLVRQSLADGQEHAAAQIAAQHQLSTVAVLTRLQVWEIRGELESRWIPGPYPRRRGYRFTGGRRG